ncbi:RelA/SpoT domain-containing protein [Moritella sp. Urea-trap-13]|uniref:RelA/SpoT domain-containing protein n=1 Tax=Moritella sp. Urea-trap-13 TaxID=2058327 RepID=UPI0012FEE4B1|nr:RelA/SpoT domain-containing protein [Moritella sp. Urea-trap-13]
MNLEEFLHKNRISKENWELADISVEELSEIEADYLDSVPHLNEAAEFLAKVLQKCKHVHSVRWRVKDAQHLLEKIVRKRSQKNPKYKDISVVNYSEIITDLVGVRVLHLFKYEWFEINQYILGCWKPLETVTAYIREGDQGSIIDSYKEHKCDVQVHPAGYRSIHYIISTQPTLKKIVSEIQMRTIFEEGWSEIDHKVRYPNFSNNELVSYFLTIFNRMAGSADEMGTFVNDLVSDISLKEVELGRKNKEQEDHISRIEELAKELSKEKNKNKNVESTVLELNAEIEKLRNSSSNATKVNVPITWSEIERLSSAKREVLKDASIEAFKNDITLLSVDKFRNSQLNTMSLTESIIWGDSAGVARNSLTDAATTLKNKDTEVKKAKPPTKKK